MTSNFHKQFRSSLPRGLIRAEIKVKTSSGYNGSLSNTVEE
uniref:Mitochondrial Rho GTPase n=1 Tax=Rhizophora mucronata TaxID=61149 RepID=A0A2P2MJY8_RHIMU